MPIESVQPKRNVEQIKAGYTAAVAIIRSIISKLSTQEFSAQELAIFQTFFLTSNPSEELIGRMKVVFQDTYTGITENNIAILQGMVMPNTKRLGKNNTIEFSLQTSATNRLAAHYFIHEATHLYGDTADHSYRGYVNADRTGFQQTGLTAEEAKNNADSYAAFAIAWSDLAELSSGLEIAK